MGLQGRGYCLTDYSLERMVADVQSGERWVQTGAEGKG